MGLGAHASVGLCGVRLGLTAGQCFLEVAPGAACEAGVRHDAAYTSQARAAVVLCIPLHDSDCFLVRLLVPRVSCWMLPAAVCVIDNYEFDGIWVAIAT